MSNLMVQSTPCQWSRQSKHQANEIGVTRTRAFRGLGLTHIFSFIPTSWMYPHMM